VNLEGSLDAFGLPDVVALLASTGKSGGLLLHRDVPGDGREEGAVWFRDGRVCGATSDRRRASLARRVVGSGAVDDNALRQAVARAASTGGGVARALLDGGAVDPDLLRQAADDQVVDAVFELLRWPDGDFAFDPRSADPDDIGLSLEPDRVLAEARARVEAWPALEAVIPSSASVLALPTVLAEDPQVSRDEWALLSLIDGHRSVHDLVELTGAGAFAVTTILARLAGRGLVHVADASSPDHVGVVMRRLAMLAGVEGGTEAAEPEPAPALAPAAHEDVSGPGHLGMSAAAALAAARAAQGLPAPGAAGSRPRHEVVPPRPEPFLPGRRPEHPEPLLPERVGSAAGAVPAGSTAHVAATSASAAPGPSAGAARAIHADAHSVDGATARTLAEPHAQTAADSVIERDPAVNRSLLLRLIAGVRGL
jgi:hypothetical protein